MEEDLKEALQVDDNACLVSQFCTELGPAQPQLVFDYFCILLHNVTYLQRDYRGLQSTIGTVPRIPCNFGNKWVYMYFRDLWDQKGG